MEEHPGERDRLKRRGWFDESRSWRRWEGDVSTGEGISCD
jgi:hypothetical protein